MVGSLPVGGLLNFKGITLGVSSDATNKTSPSVGLSVDGNRVLSKTVKPGETATVKNLKVPTGKHTAELSVSAGPGALPGALSGSSSVFAGKLLFQGAGPRTKSVPFSVTVPTSGSQTFTGDIWAIGPLVFLTPNEALSALGTGGMFGGGRKLQIPFGLAPRFGAAAQSFGLSPSFDSAVGPEGFKTYFPAGAPRNSYGAEAVTQRGFHAANVDQQLSPPQPGGYTARRSPNVAAAINAIRNKQQGARAQSLVA